MVRIKKVLAVPTSGSYYCEDVTELQKSSVPLSERYTTPSSTHGFNFLREVGEAVSVGLVLSDGRIAWGDCVGVAYGGKAGRDPVFRSQRALQDVDTILAPFLVGKPVDVFREIAPACERIDVSLALRYGVSQALLNAAALLRGKSPTQIICEEWDLPLPDKAAALHAQSGSERYHTVDKMIARRIDSLPHGLVDDIPEQLGEKGERLVAYARWISLRLVRLGIPTYQPAIHLDVHGAIGQLLNHDATRILELLEELQKAADPYRLRMESVLIAESRGKQMALLDQLRDMLRSRKISVDLVADEWANTLEDIKAFADSQCCDMIQVKMPDLGGLQNSIDAVLYCHKRSIQTLLGGSCNETDISSRLTAHVALATQPTLVMAKPGMGVDEGVMLIRNEMLRTLKEIHP